MSVDPDELKVRRVKREQQVHDIQKYMEEQEALDKRDGIGKMGHREIRQEHSVSAVIGSLVERALRFLRGK